MWDETFDFIVSVDDVFDNRKLECEVWDRDPYGVRDYMGKVKVDLNPLLLRIKDLPPAPGQAYTKTLKINEEIAECASGRLEMEFQFYPAKGYTRGLGSKTFGSRKKRGSWNDGKVSNELTIDTGPSGAVTPAGRSLRGGTGGGLTADGDAPASPLRQGSIRSPASKRGMMALAEEFVEREGTLSVDGTDGKSLDSEIKALKKEKRKTDKAKAKKEGGGCCSCFGGGKKGAKGGNGGKGHKGGNAFLARIEEVAPDSPDSVFQELPSPRPSDAAA